MLTASSGGGGKPTLEHHTALLLLPAWATRAWALTRCACAWDGKVDSRVHALSKFWLGC